MRRRLGGELANAVLEGSQGSQGIQGADAATTTTKTTTGSGGQVHRTGKSVGRPCPARCWSLVCLTRRPHFWVGPLWPLWPSQLAPMPNILMAAAPVSSMPLVFSSSTPRFASSCSLAPLSRLRWQSLYILRFTQVIHSGLNPYNDTSGCFKYPSTTLALPKPKERPDQTRLQRLSLSRLELFLQPVPILTVAGCVHPKSVLYISTRSTTARLARIRVGHFITISVPGKAIIKEHKAQRTKCN